MDFSQIAILLVVAATFGIVAKRFRQPILIGYLFAGFVLALLGILNDTSLIVGLGKVGIALLLFLVGLEMNLKELPSIGKVALFTGLIQMSFTFTAATLIAILLGFSVVPAAYIGIAMSFSSTIIIIKLLSEKNDLGSLYGKIAVGFLLVQDLVAILILVFLSGLNGGGNNITSYLLIAVKAIVLLGAVWFLSKKFLPKFFERYIAQSQELLFIVSIAWALGVASLVAGPFGFTLEVGGFLAGLALSNLPEHLEIASRVRPLRDFFLTIFFLGLGSSLVVTGVSGVILPALIFSVLVLIGNPIIMMSVLGFMRFKKRTSFLASVTVAQISEFSLIIVGVGATLGHLTDQHVALTVIVAAITMTASTYLILGANKVYLRLQDKLTIFERKNPKENVLIEREEKLKDHIILVGCDKTGRSLLTLLKKKKISYLIIDFNPSVVEGLIALKEPVIFGDIGDP
ncbi:cation:proton antiporter, partial [Patescibacteria group bacterium]